MAATSSSLPSPVFVEPQALPHSILHHAVLGPVSAAMASEEQQLLLENQLLLEPTALLPATGAQLALQEESRVMDAIDKALAVMAPLQIPMMDVIMQDHDDLVVADMTPCTRALAESLAGPAGTGKGDGIGAGGALGRGDGLDGLIGRGPITSPALSSLLASPRMHG
jgi:hypothetical protein